MHLALVDYLLWIVPWILLAIAAIAVYRRNWQRNYPYFVAYLFLQIFTVPLLIAIASFSYRFYYYAYYAVLLLSIFLSFGVLWEISDIVLGWGRSRLLSFFILLFAATLFVGASELVLSFGTSAGSAVGQLTHSLLLFDRLLRLAQITFLVGIGLFSRMLGVPRRSFLFGLILGFGIFATANMLVATTFLQHTHSAITLSRLNGVAYLAASLIWVAYCIFGDQENPRTTSALPTTPGSKLDREEIVGYFCRATLLHGRSAANS